VDGPVILVSNDDGVRAPGIAALHRALGPLGRVTVVAPDRERSASSHSLTLDVPLRANRISDDVVSVEGTPTDCVLLAVKDLLPQKPALVVSGINRGPNMGHDVTYSGTVAAAMEATLVGIPAIAVSLDRSPDGRFDYTAAGEVAREMAALVLARGLPEGTLLNVNVPNCPDGGIRGVALTRLGKQIYEDSVVRKTDPRGREYFWIAGQSSTWAVEPDTDFAAVKRGLVSVTPIHMDMTDYRMLETLREWPLAALATPGRTPDPTTGDGP